MQCHRHTDLQQPACRKGQDACSTCLWDHVSVTCANVTEPLPFGHDSVFDKPVVYQF